MRVLVYVLMVTLLVYLSFLYSINVYIDICAHSNTREISTADNLFYNTCIVIHTIILCVDYFCFVLLFCFRKTKKTVYASYVVTRSPEA